MAKITAPGVRARKVRDGADPLALAGPLAGVLHRMRLLYGSYGSTMFASLAGARES